MHAEDLVIDKSCDWQAVEAVSEDLPEFDTVAALALIIEAIDAINGSAFVVASQ